NRSAPPATPSTAASFVAPDGLVHTSAPLEAPPSPVTLATADAPAEAVPPSVEGRRAPSPVDAHRASLDRSRRPSPLKTAHADTRDAPANSASPPSAATPAPI